MRLWLILIFLASRAMAQNQANWQCPITKGDVDKSKISSDYGPRRPCPKNGSLFHRGIDLAYGRGTPIYAVESGYAQYRGRRNNVVMIKHPFPFGVYRDSLPSRYLHGETVGHLPRGVSRGDLIAYVSDRGCPGSPHLHFDFGGPEESDVRYSPLCLLPYNNQYDPGPITFLNLSNGQTVSRRFTRKATQGIPANPIRVKIITTEDKDLNKAELWVDTTRIDRIIYDPPVPENIISSPYTYVGPFQCNVGLDTFKFEWNTANFPDGNYTLKVQAYDVRNRMGESSIWVKLQHIRDVGTQGINYPRGIVPPGTQVYPKAVVKNFGTRAETISVFFIIRDSSNNQVYRSIIDNFIIAPYTSRIASFGNWVANPKGNYTAKCFTSLMFDTNPLNDACSLQFTVWSNGGGGGGENPDNPNNRHRENFDNPDSPYYCRPDHPCGYCCICRGLPDPCCGCGTGCSGCCACQSNCPGCCYCTGLLPFWPPSCYLVFFTMSTFKTCWHQKTGPPWNDNTTPYAYLDWDFSGGSSIERLISPIINLANCTTVILRCSTYFVHRRDNYTAQILGSIDGGITYPYLIRSYNSSFGPGVETFNISSWARGQPRVRFAWVYNGGINKIDFWALDNVTVIGLPGFQHDIGLNEVRAPRGRVPCGTLVQPKVTIGNFGKETETLKVFCEIGNFYRDSVYVLLPPAKTSLLRFKEWLAIPGTHTIKAYSSLARDGYRANDTVVGIFRVVADSWIIKEQALAKIKSGGAIVGTKEHLYVLTGYPNMAFLRYLPEMDQWRRMASPPKDPDAGGSLAWAGGDYIYMLEGGSSRGFYRYNIKTNEWASLANAPQKIGTGGALAWGGGDYLFALRGKDKRSFYRYRISTNSWDSLTWTPDKIGFGGALVWDKGNSFYALRGDNKRSFYRYRINGNFWEVLSPTPANVHFGGSLAFDTSNSKVYAFRGNETREFWVYTPATNSWHSRTVTPQAVGKGGALTFYKGSIYGLRGRNERDFWNYALPAGGNFGSKSPSPPKTRKPKTESFGGERGIVLDSLENTRPVFSPDGTWICYQKLDSNGCYQIYKISIETGEEIQLTDCGFTYKTPQWSLDGEWIACVRDGEIYIMRSDGTEGEVLASGICSDPQWSPNGEMILFTKWEGNHKLYIVSTDGEYEEALIEDNCERRFPQWAPNGEWIIYQKLIDDRFQICKLCLATGEEIQLTDNIYDNTAPLVSPNGNLVVYERVDEDGYRQIYKISAEGGEEIALTTEPYDHESPQVSPDNSWVSYVKWISGSESHICKTPLESPSEVMLTNSEAVREFPDISPQGNLIVYEKESEERFGDRKNRAIFIVRTDGSIGVTDKFACAPKLRGLIIQNLSNPTRGITHLHYNLPPKEIATLKIYSSLGNIVYSAKSDKGYFTIKKLPAGIYILRFEAKGYKEERKLVVVK